MTPEDFLVSTVSNLNEDGHTVIDEGKILLGAVYTKWLRERMAKALNVS